MRRTPAHPFPPKLAYDDAERIRERYGRGESARALAREFGVSASCLYDVLGRKSYAGRLVIVLTGAEIRKLDVLAKRTGAAREQIATVIIRSRLAQIPATPQSS